jgi:hypothetical protein
MDFSLPTDLNDQHCGSARLEALRRIGSAVDEAGLYERVLLRHLDCVGGSGARKCE